MPSDDSPKPRQRRLSIGKTYSQSGVVAELLSMLETVTADGNISEEEAQDLDQWIQTNKSDLSLPGIQFLQTTIQQILADGQVTPEERAALYKAVERVLPPEARRVARERRSAAEAIEKDRVRAAKEAKKDRERDERERIRPVVGANFMIAGISHEGRDRVIGHYANEGDVVFLARDPSNPYDSSAIEIRLKEGFQIGFVPRDEAADLAGFLDGGYTHRAYITKILQGRRWPIPVVQTHLYRPDANIPGAVSQLQVPPRRQADLGRNGLGCFGHSVVMIGLMALLLFVLLSILR